MLRLPRPTCGYGRASCAICLTTLPSTRIAELRRGGAPVSVEPQVFDLLVYLIQNRSRVVSKDDLLASVWGGRIVSELALFNRLWAPYGKTESRRPRHRAEPASSSPKQALDRRSAVHEYEW